MFNAIHAKLPLLLENPESYLGQHDIDKAYVRRLQKVTEYAEKHTTLDTEKVQDDTAKPLIAVYQAPDRADNLYTQDPEVQDRIHDWLASGAATAGIMTDQAPLHLSCPVDSTGAFVLSVPYATQKNPQKRYDVRPVMARLNAREPGTWGGRAEVILNYKPTRLTAEEIIRAARDVRGEVELDREA